MKYLLMIALLLFAAPALAKEYTVKEMSDPGGDKPYYFEPSELTIQPGDMVTFVNAQEDVHNVMFNVVPVKVDALIMSPDLTKEGEKWSYTFTVPGSYQFHCHPHEKLGMKGKLIVGHPSKAGETKKVDHDAAGLHLAKGVLPEGEGKINSIDLQKHTVTIAHQPIAALRWPVMTMEFPVEDSVHLLDFKAGDAVTFTLKPRNKKFSVASLKPKQ